MSSSKPLSAVFVEPFMGGSHAAFARGWIDRSRHDWRLVTLPAERWKWRMRAAAFVLAPRLAALAPAPDVVVVSGLLDLAHLRQLAGLPARTRWLLYLHENQLSYPRPLGKPLDRGFAVAHLASLLAADGAAINSRAHRDALRADLAAFLEEIPPPRPRGVAGRLARMEILPPGLDLSGFPEPESRPAGEPPVIVWNHRWEEDKRPAAFARIMLKLAEKGLPFRLVLLGPTVQARPKPLEMLKDKLSERILCGQPAQSMPEYVAWLSRGDIAVSTAAQENFGYAALEAMAAGAVPLLPERLSYPEIVPKYLASALLYRSDRDLLARLVQWLSEPARFTGWRARAMTAARRHGWEERAAALDRWLEGCGQPKRNGV